MERLSNQWRAGIEHLLAPPLRQAAGFFPAATGHLGLVEEFAGRKEVWQSWWRGRGASQWPAPLQILSDYRVAVEDLSGIDVFKDNTDLRHQFTEIEDHEWLLSGINLIFDDGTESARVALSACRHKDARLWSAACDALIALRESMGIEYEKVLDLDLGLVSRHELKTWRELAAEARSCIRSAQDQNAVYESFDPPRLGDLTKNLEIIDKINQWLASVAAGPQSEDLPLSELLANIPNVPRLRKEAAVLQTCFDAERKHSLWVAAAADRNWQAAVNDLKGLLEEYPVSSSRLIGVADMLKARRSALDSKLSQYQNALEADTHLRAAIDHLESDDVELAEDELTAASKCADSAPDPITSEVQLWRHVLDTFKELVKP